MLKIIVLFAMLSQNVRAENSDSTSDSLQKDSLIINNSSLKTQLDSASSLLKKIGEIVEESVNSFAEGLNQNEKKTKEALESEIRKEFYKLTAKLNPVPIIKAWELLTIYKDSTIILVDVRKSEEMEVSIIPNAYSTEEFSRKFSHPKMLKEKMIIGYCTIGYRSEKYLQQLVKLNLNVKNLEGGILSWTHCGGPLVRKDSHDLISETREVHTYTEEWNLTAPGYFGRW